MLQRCRTIVHLRNIAGLLVHQRILYVCCKFVMNLSRWKTKLPFKANVSELLPQNVKRTEHRRNFPTNTHATGCKHSQCNRVNSHQFTTCESQVTALKYALSIVDVTARIGHFNGLETEFSCEYVWPTSFECVCSKCEYHFTWKGLKNMQLRRWIIKSNITRHKRSFVSYIIYLYIAYSYNTWFKHSKHAPYEFGWTN